MRAEMAIPKALWTHTEILLSGDMLRGPQGIPGHIQEQLPEEV